jgi:alpha-N-acetylglucosamine transferase
VLDSDSTVLKHMDELFFVPPAPVVVPRAYWLSNPMLSSHIMLIQPSEQDFKRVQKAIKKASGTVYDMEIVNDLFGDSCIVLPHQQYALLTGEFRRGKHRQFLEENGQWNPQKVIDDAKFVHFSDDPFPKPWLDPTEEMLAWATPVCIVDALEVESCRAREIWLELYRDFKTRRKVGLDLSVFIDFTN